MQLLRPPCASPRCARPTTSCPQLALYALQAWLLTCAAYNKNRTVTDSRSLSSLSLRVVTSTPPKPRVTATRPRLGSFRMPHPRMRSQIVLIAPVSSFLRSQSVMSLRGLLVYVLVLGAGGLRAPRPLVFPFVFLSHRRVIAHDAHDPIPLIILIIRWIPSPTVPPPRSLSSCPH